MTKPHRLPLVGVNDDATHEPLAAEPAASSALLRVGELARACGKTVRAIHHYENIGLLQPHSRSKGRYRLYASDAVARVGWINKLHDLGMSLSEIQEILGVWEGSPSAPEAMAAIRAVYVQKRREVRLQIARLSALERELGASVDYLDTCETCDPNELVAACSACTVHDCHTQEPGLVAGLHAGNTLSLAQH